MQHTQGTSVLPHKDAVVANPDASFVSSGHGEQAVGVYACPGGAIILDVQRTVDAPLHDPVADLESPAIRHLRDGEGLVTKLVSSYTD